MSTNLHFIAGLPRSGSTLLAAILRQNPKIHAEMTSPLGPIVNACLNAMGADNEFSSMLKEGQKRAILRGIFKNYYRLQGDCEVVFDTNRMWPSHLPLIDRIFPRAKVICCVRNPAWVLDSIEHLISKNVLDSSKLFGSPAERATVYSRAEALLNHNRLVGFAWSSLKEAYYGAHNSKLLMIDYDLLANRPSEVVSLIYQFLKIDSFDHDFDHVSYESEQFDNELLVKGLHRVKGKVAPRPRQTILPPDLFDRCQKLAFWHNPHGTAAHRIVVNRDQDENAAVEAPHSDQEKKAISTCGA